MQWDFCNLVQEAGAEAAIHAIREISENEDTAVFLLIDAENAFTSINRKVMLHNLFSFVQSLLRISQTVILHLQDDL